LITLDIADYKNPEVLSITDLPLDSNFQLSVSRDDKLLFVSSSGALITLDISNKTSIKIADTQLLKVSTFLPIDENVLIGNENGLQIMNRKPKYALEMSNHKFSLGRVYSNPVKILELKRGSNYSTIGQNYKFVQASLFTGEIRPLKEFLVSYPVLPSWIYFDKENALLNLDLTQSINVTSYKIRFSISTEVLADDFLQIEEANYTQDDVQNLQAYLFGQGYLDSERYLTANFDENTPLMLKTKYSKFEPEIRKILKSHRIEVIAPISLESSLQLVHDKPLQIITPSLNSIHVEIKLESVHKPKQQSKFVSQAFSAVKTNLDDNKTVLTLEEASLYINEAFQKLLVNVEDDSLSCEGSIRVWDGLNPPIIENFGDMSKYIETNKKPQMLAKYSIQGQIEKVAIIAGEHFNIEFDEMTFYDLNNRSLIYSLEMPDENMEVPAWITLRGRTLMGTPPEQFWKYEQEFCIKASNEYKSESIVFKLQVGLSYVIILKRVLFLMGYLFTAYKSWQYSDKFYNILCRRRYRYPKIIHVEAGREVTKKEIFPIVLISKRVQKLSKSVLSEIKLSIGEGRVASDEKTIEYLVDSDSGSLNRPKLAEVIESLALQKQIGKNKEVVQQLIASELTIKRIKPEKATLNIFEKMKSKWIDLVDIDQAQFVIKGVNLIRELRVNDVNIADPNEYQLDNNDSEILTSSTKRSVERELIPSPRVNLGLLKDAILAYAFEQQNIWKSRYRIRIQSKELMENERSNFWRRFLKLDTIDLVQNSAKQLGHGLKFEFIGDQMIFYGKPKEEMKNKTLIKKNFFNF